MEKIVLKGIKIDLHIHSEFSRKKDGEKVAHNTIENLPILVEKLKKNEVEMCAITDHDTFNYELYSKLKNEEKNANCIKKVLPGIEFSVEFVEKKIIHIVTIFDDKDEEKVKYIEEVMLRGKGKTLYDKSKEAYSRKNYFEILSEINLDFVMIAHQKKSPCSQDKPQSKDVMSLGKKLFNELVFMDYFDAYEFRNKRNEIYNKAYSIENNVEENLRFITGSDCHRWEFYPNTEKMENTNFKFTFIKSLPTFRGLAMAITDHHRIELENSFFNPNEKYLENIILKVDNQENIIPLSKGINVIIGDNSIGKSLFLYAITGDYKNINKGLKNGYRKYMEKNKIDFQTTIKEEDIFRYNQQGEIRQIFDDDGLRPDKYLEKFYPDEINSVRYRDIIDNEFENLIRILKTKFNYDEEKQKLPSFVIPKEDAKEKEIIFIDNLEKEKTKNLQEVVDLFEKAIKDIEKICDNTEVLEEDKKHLGTTAEMLIVMKEKYAERICEVKRKNEKINMFNTFMKDYRIKYEKRNTDEQVVFADYIEQKEMVKEKIAEIWLKENNLEEYKPNVSEINIIPETNPVDKYKFISKLQIEKIDNEYVYDVLSSILRKNQKINTKKITQSELKNMIKNYPNEDEIAPIDALREKINSRLDKDFKIRNTIVEKNMDVYQEVSAGFDAQMYFTLLSGEMRNRGIYIIDQPEDHISQRAIKEKVLEQFRRMGQQRQIIMVTHNPQFIVNLDVDNVIFLSKVDGKFKIESGALEYENDEYKILKIVADNIEGGLQTIQGRMKRYEKNI